MIIVVPSLQKQECNLIDYTRIPRKKGKKMLSGWGKRRGIRSGAGQKDGEKAGRHVFPSLGTHFCSARSKAELEKEGEI